MKKLFAPWRSEYSNDVTAGKQEEAQPQSCAFCKQLAQNKDQSNFILKRFKHSFVMLNKYPYNAGHLLVLPIKHVSALSELSKEERTELMELTNLSIDILYKSLKNDGLNAGFNLGKAAGAGIPSHLHMHVLPRWQGDTNFMPTIAETKVISFDLAQLYKQLKPEFDKITL
ncbi:HIT domain-containing protein [Candidatus Dependentiae bacterium]